MGTYWTGQSNIVVSHRVSHRDEYLSDGTKQHIAGNPSERTQCYAFNIGIERARVHACVFVAKGTSRWMWMGVPQTQRALSQCSIDKVSHLARSLLRDGPTRLFSVLDRIHSSGCYGGGFPHPNGAEVFERSDVIDIDAMIQCVSA